jgi:hypothetical protein
MRYCKNIKILKIKNIKYKNTKTVHNNIMKIGGQNC